MTKRHGWLAVAALFLATGCNNPIQSDLTVAGTYDLTTVDGSPPPVVVAETGGSTLEVTGGTLTLKSDLNCTLKEDFRTTVSGSSAASTRTDNCTWTRTGTAVFLTVEGVGAVPGTWDDAASTLSFTYQGFDLVFTRK